MILLKLFWCFFKIGLFTFGGGYAMIPLIQDIVIQNDWMTMEQIVDFIAVSETTPGPLAINMATYTGYEVAGIMGAFMCTLGVTIPSFTVILLVAKAYKKFESSRTVKGAMKGIKPAVVGLIATASLSIAGNVFHIGRHISDIVNKGSIIGGMILAMAIIMTIKKKHPIVIVCASALAGIVLNYCCGFTGLS